MFKEKGSKALAITVLALVVALVSIKISRNKPEKNKEVEEETKIEETIEEETTEEDNKEEVEEESEEDVETEKAEMLESVISVEGTVKELYENGDILIETIDGEEMVLKEGLDDMPEFEVLSGDNVIAFAMIGTPQTMELPASFRYQAIEGLKDGFRYKGGIFDADGLSDDKQFEIVLPEGEKFELAGKSIVVKYKNSTRSIPEKVNLEDIEIIELKRI